MAIQIINGGFTDSDPNLLPVSGVNAKGDWGELGTTSMAVEFIVAQLGPFTHNDEYFFDIGTGAEASEVALVQNMFAQRETGSANRIEPRLLPIGIPTATRVAARFQTTSATSNGRMQLILCATDTVPLTNCTSSVTYGANTTTTRGVTIDPGTTINTKPATYTEITSATSADIHWLSVEIGNRDNGTQADTTFRIDVATGAASSESIIIPDLWIMNSAGMDNMSTWSIGPFPITIASGTRLSARAQCSGNDATDRLFDIAIIGFEGTAASSGGASFSAHIR